LARGKKHLGHRANLMDVADHVGVSAMTVSRALNQPEKVADATRERIEAAIEALGYVPTLAANTLRRERSGVIVVVVPTIDQSVFSDTVQGIADVLGPAGYQLLLGCASYDPTNEEDLVRAFLGHRPDGMILTGTLHTPTTRRHLANAAIPVVEMWDVCDENMDMAVGFDNYAAGYAIARHMFDCGYDRVGYVATEPAHEARENRAAKRSSGIYTAFSDAGRPSPVRMNVRDPLNIHESGAIAADFVLSNPDLDAIICANEIIGVGAMIELRQRGSSVPDDVGISGIGDANIAALVSPGLTTVQFPGYDIGTQSAELLLARLRDPASASERRDIGFQVVSRGSTRSPAKATR